MRKQQLLKLIEPFCDEAEIEIHRGLIWIEGKTIDQDSIPIEPPVIKTDKEWYCIECKQLCAVYEQGLSCGCGNGRWENEAYEEKEYPKKWKRVEVVIRSL